MIENLKSLVMNNDNAYGDAWENPEIVENGASLNGISAEQCVDLIKYINLRYCLKKRKRCRKGWYCNKKKCSWNIYHRIHGRKIDGATDKYAEIKKCAAKKKKSKGCVKNAIKSKNLSTQKIKDNFNSLPGLKLPAHSFPHKNFKRQNTEIPKKNIVTQKSPPRVNSPHVLQPDASGRYPSPAFRDLKKIELDKKSRHLTKNFKTKRPPPGLPQNTSFSAGK
jgi:hypothetical protein